MARAKATAKKTDDKSKLTSKEVIAFLEDKKQCGSCGKILELTKGFYICNSGSTKFTGRMNICKNCLNALLVEYAKESEDIKVSIYKICRETGVYFTEDLFNSSYTSKGYNEQLGIVENTLEVWKEYIKNVNSLKQNNGKSFDDGKQLNLEEDGDEGIDTTTIIDEYEIEKQLEFKRNKADIIKMLGYYPFEGEDSQELLCGQLVTFLGDEDVKDDSIKLNAIISIIRTQRAVDSITKSLSEKTKDMSRIDDKLGSIKQMSAIQKDLSKAVLDTAKDNKLTDLWSGKKTAGANSLTGTLYKLRQINLDEAQANLFDIKTSWGMTQAAIQSDKGIVANLTWGDDDSMEMIREQRILIRRYYNEYLKLKEENRKFKVLCNFNGIDYKQDGFIQEVDYVELPEINERGEILLEELNRVKKDDERILSEFEKIETQVLNMSTLEYCENVIKQREEEEKAKLIDELMGKNED